MGKAPRTEYLDYINNEFGLELARQGLSPKEAKDAIMMTIASGGRNRELGGVPQFVMGRDTLQNINDVPKSRYPWFNYDE